MDDYCGCCGRLVNRGDHGSVWCRRCAAHVLLSGPFESRTFFAQHKRECPWQVSSSARPMEDAS